MGPNQPGLPPSPEDPRIPELIKYTPEDVERIADVLALVTAAWFVAAAASWAGKDNWIVALAMLGAAWFLVGQYNGPVRSLLRSIFAAVLDAIFQAVNLIYAFLYMAVNYWGGRIVSLILHIVLWMLAGWFFERLNQYPAIQRFWEAINKFVTDLFNFVRDLVLTVRNTLMQLDQWVKQAVDQLFGAIFDLAKRFSVELGALRDFMLGHIRLMIEFTKQDLMAFWNAGFARILGELDAALIRINNVLRDTQLWLISQIGDVVVRIGDVEVRIPLVALYQAWVLGEDKARSAVDQANDAMLRLDLSGVQFTSDLGTWLDWAIQDLEAAAEGQSDVPELNLMFEWVKEDITALGRRYDGLIAA
jgi:hypothetical protein